MPTVAVLMVAGLQVPLMPLLEEAGNVGAGLFRQSGPMAVNTGVTLEDIVMSMLTGAAHSPAAGVKV